MTFRFRESFRGYNRSDVNSYIEQINQKFNRREEELKKEIDALKNGDALKNDSDTQKLQEQIELLKAENAALLQENGTLRENPYEDEVIALQRENETLRENPFEKELIALRNENETLRSEKLKADENSSKIGNILIVASNNAEKIIENARNEAGKIIAEANVKAGTIIYDAEVEKNRIVDEFSAKISNISRSYLKECTDIIAENSGRLNSISENLKSKLLQ